MRYLGIAKKEKGKVILPDTLGQDEKSTLLEALEIGGDIILVPSPFNRERLLQVEKLARQSIQEHRQTLEGLAH